MDLGLFARRKWEFWAWVFVPAAIIVALQCFLEVYAWRVASALEQRKALIQVVPQMQAKLSASREVLKGFAHDGAVKIEPAEEARRSLSKSARQNGFLIDELSVESGEGKAAGRAAAPAWSPSTKVQMLTVSLKGEGSLTALMRFMDTIEKPENLVTMGAVGIRQVRREAEPVYQADFSFRCHILSI